MSTIIRIIVTDPGGGNRPTQTITVSGNESFAQLNALILPEYANHDHVIKWIYLGHTLSEESLPRNLESGSTLHVVVRHITRLPTASTHAQEHSTILVSDVDKHLLRFIHLVFVVFLAFLWNQYMQDRSLFTGLSLTVLVGLSVVFLLSLVHQVYPS